ncbi:uncharacterized protein JCM6883_007176 [Sporobolomyces salmoneus]|uniref:uncharacterized protein n=1 Tax=Sporobolomyces salmoneus TaxID=183962 RepID=UPI003179D4A0
MEASTTTTDYFPPPHPLPPHLERPSLPVGSSSDDSISTIATESSLDSLPLTFSPLARHPYSSLVYTPPARPKDQFIDDEGLLAKRFDGLGNKARAEAELTAGKYGREDRVPKEEEDEHRWERTEEYEAPSSFASFAFPPPHHSGPPRHTSLPAIVTSANSIAGISATSPIDRSPLSPSSSLPYPTSSALLTGSAVSSTPDASPGHSPVLSSSSTFPLVSSDPTRIVLPPRHQPFHQRAATASASSSISPRSSLPAQYHPSGMARSGSTPNAAFPSSSSSSSSFLQSPIARSTSSCVIPPPWALATTGGNRPGSAGTSSTNRTSRSSGSTSTRPWVFDSDASSVCSANSGGGGWSSAGGGNVHHKTPTTTVKESKTTGTRRERRVTEDGEEFEVDEGGEVFKPESDVEFLDHRPEPPGAKLSINRDDPHQVVLKVTLPGFSLDNITVAMRRGHKIHIVADSYGETGGHFEKLVHLGSDVSSVAPRAEFNGTDLNVYIQRRPSRPSSSASVSTAGGSTQAMPPFGSLPTNTIPGSPASTFSSPDLDHNQRRPSSIASAWSLSENGSTHHQHQRDSINSSAASPYPLSPSLEYPSPISSSSEDRRLSQDIPPPFTVVAPPLSSIEAEARKSKSRCLTGPEGAKAAAKAAREEATKRAKEEAKKLPSSARGGRRLPFRRQKEDGTGYSGSSGSAGEGSAGEASAWEGSNASANESKKDPSPHPVPSPVEERQQPSIDRNGTIKASNSRSNSPLPVTPTDTSSPFDSSSESSTTNSVSSAASSVRSSPTHSPPRLEPRPLPLFTNPSNPHHTHPRPKLREGNLTLRAPDGQSFLDQAQRQWSLKANANAHARGSGNESEVEEFETEGESLTPRWEHTGMKFHH